MWSGRDGYRKAWNNQVCKMIHNNKVSLMAGHWANWVAVRITFVAHLGRSSRGKFVLQRSSVQKLFVPRENQLSSMKPLKKHKLFLKPRENKHSGLEVPVCSPACYPWGHCALTSINEHQLLLFESNKLSCHGKECINRVGSLPCDL